MRIVLLIAFLGVWSASIVGQIKTTGLPYIRDYPKSDYKAGTQNWDICQDERGIMYFANNDGVLQYDGANWRTYSLANNSIVRNVEISEEGTLYASGFNEFGYFEVTKKGDLEYVSLIRELPEEYKNMEDVWRIHETSSGIIFQSFNYVFAYKNDTVKVIASGENFGFSFYVDDRLFVHDENEGLKELRGNHLYLVNGGRIFRDDMEIWSMHEFQNGQILIGTQQHGLYLYDGYDIKQFECQANKKLSKKQVFSSAKIDSNHFAYGTIQDGVIIINQNGEVLQHLNKEKGLLNNTVLQVFKDHNGQLWLGLDNGINYLEINSPFTYFRDGMGIEGTGYDAKLFEGDIFLATNQGLFTKKWDQNARNTYKLLPNIKGQVWSLNKFGNKLLVGHNRGVYAIGNTTVNEIFHNQGTWEFIKLDAEKELVLAGTYNSLIILNKENGRWQYRNKVKGFNESSRVLEQDSTGNIWISHGYKGIYRLRLSESYDSVETKDFYDTHHGLPSNIDNYVYKLRGEVVFGTEKGIYEFDTTTGTFAPHPYWQQWFGQEKNIRFPKEDSAGNIWYSVNETPHFLEKTKEGYTKKDSLFAKIKDVLVGGFEDIEVFGPHDIIFSAENGFVHYDPRFRKKTKKHFYPLVRSVVSTSNGDSVIYMGNSEKTSYKKDNRQKDINTLPFSNNDLRFNISATFFETNDVLTYKTFLKGYDNHWSVQSSNNIKEYTNLPPGEYTFMAKASGIKESKVTEFHFEILPPWYRTIAAYIIYGIITAFLITLLIYYLSRRIKREKAKLKEKQQKELQEKERKYRQEALEADQKITQLRNEKLQVELDKKKADVELKNKEVVSTAMQITHKNEILNEIKKKLTNVSQKVNDQAQDEIQKLISTIDNDVRMDKDWEKFQKHFEDVHSDFFKILHEKYPELTPKDLRMCAYLRMNLSTKEIALISNISVRGVEISRYRLRKKLDVPKDQNLVDFIMNIN
ncbi:MAG: hypothetical protein K9I68_04030 [Bacteroidales bacterium]|nr:hypothetical protein [Bacteroidales bacterium]MCF8336392.1 hypothetical protein [Bacteroidales bacterium]